MALLAIVLRPSSHLVIVGEPLFLTHTLRHGPGTPAVTCGIACRHV